MVILISVYQIKKYAVIFLILRGRKTIAVVTDNFQVDTLRFFFSEDHFAFCRSGNDRSHLLLIKKVCLKRKKATHTRLLSLNYKQTTQRTKYDKNNF